MIQYKQIIPGIFLLVLGLCMILFRRFATRWTSGWTYRLYRIKYNVQIYQVAFVISGFAFVMIGILVLLNIIVFR